MANEKRLIDAINKEMPRLPDTNYKLGYSHGLNKAKDIVLKLDAVEVVRCKDCKHRGSDLCPMETVELYPWFATKNDAFCSYGERRTE